MGLDPYEKIKELFYNVLDRNENIDGIKIIKSEPNTNYLSSIYNRISDDTYFQERKMSLELMELGRTKFDELMMETICRNLHIYLLVILQNIKGRGIRREAFLNIMSVTEAENKKCSDRFRKRLMPDRLKALQYIMTENGLSYFAPKLLKAYKDVFFIPRQGTDIIDISSYYIDIFAALMFDTDEEKSNEDFLCSRGIIKSYSLWCLASKDVKQAEIIYNKIEVSKRGGDKNSETLLMEKMFGLLNISEILQKGCTKKEVIEITGCLKSLVQLGFSGFHKEVIQKINMKNKYAYEHMINEYIYPLCCKCLKVFLNDIIKYLGRIKNCDREDFVENFKNVCENYIGKSKCNMGLNSSVFGVVDRLNKYKKFNAEGNFIVCLIQLLQGVEGDNEESRFLEHIQCGNVSHSSDRNSKIDLENSFCFDRDIIELTFPYQYNGQYEYGNYKADTKLINTGARIKY